MHGELESVCQILSVRFKFVYTFADLVSDSVPCILLLIYFYSFQDRRHKNFSLYGNLEYLFGPTQDEVTDDTSTKEGIEMIMLMECIAHKMARDHHMLEIP